MSEERERERGNGQRERKDRGSKGEREREDKEERGCGPGGESERESDIEGRTVKITASQEIDLSRINVNLMSRCGSIMYNVCIGLPYMTCFQSTHYTHTHCMYMYISQNI